MDEEMPHIEVRAVQVTDAPALYEVDTSFETDQIYTLRVCNHIVLHEQNTQDNACNGSVALSFELVETQVDPPLYKDYRENSSSVEEIEAQLHIIEGGYVALANGEVAGCVLLKVEEWRSVALIQELTVGRQFRRYGIGSLLLRCAADWARNQKCWAILLETQNVNYPAIQFYLRNGLEIWSINQHFYPPGNNAHEIAIFMGKQVSVL